MTTINGESGDDLDSSEVQIFIVKHMSLSVMTFCMNVQNSVAFSPASQLRPQSCSFFCKSSLGFFCISFVTFLGSVINSHLRNTVSSKILIFEGEAVVHAKMLTKHEHPALLLEVEYGQPFTF